MRLFDNLPDEVKTCAEEIYSRGYAAGFQHATLCFQWSSGQITYAPTEIATHISGTGAPENETWEEMKKREVEAGATTIKPKV